MKRLRISLLAGFLLLCSYRATSQAHCDGVRYAQPVFDDLDSMMAVQFGSNVTSAGFQKDLYMDIYYPASEFFFRRPVILLAHGGSFLVGSRHEMRGLCRRFAQHGMVAATIDYRLYDAFAQQVDSLIAFDIAVKAMGDYKAAVRWFREMAANGNELGIDSNMIFVSGISAGAIAALHLAYFDPADYAAGSYVDSIITANGGIRGSSSANLQYGDHANGVVNYSGALKDARWIDPGEPTVFSVHDEFDEVVPYGRDVSTAIGTAVELWGSAEVHAKARKANIRSQLMTIEGSSGHVSYFLSGPASPIFQQVIDTTGYFLEYTICERAAAVRESARVAAINLYPNPAATHVWLTASTVDLVVISTPTGLQLQTLTGAPVRSIDLSGLPHGALLISCYEKGKLIATRRVVKP